MVTLFTVGHSGHSPEEFVALLLRHRIKVVVDVRSSPYSRYVPHSNRENPARLLLTDGIDYRWMGDRLGGKPHGDVADYDRLRSSLAFRQGIQDLMALAAQGETAIMCSEGDHRQCHRHKLIAPALEAAGAQVLHIQPDGSIVDEGQEPRQLTLL